jgi:Tfp pilus assembly protein PilN
MRAVNLIPSDQRRGGANLAGRSGGAAYVVVGLICGLAVMALLYGLAAHEISSKQAQAEQLSAEAQQEQARADKLAPYTTFVALREERLKAVQELANTRFDWAHAMHELGRVLPGNASLSNVTATVGASATGTSAAPASAPASAAGATASSTVTSATPAGSVPSFTIQGCATSQSEVALTMNRLRLIDGVNEVSLQSSSKGGGCFAGAPTFVVQVSFDALPAPAVKTPSSTGAATTSASDTPAGASGNTGSGVTAR